MFVMTDEIEVPVAAKIAGANGKPFTHKFTALFKRLTQEQLDEINEAIAEHSKLQRAELRGADVDEERMKHLEGVFGDKRIVEDFMVGWKNYKAGDGTSVEYSDEALASALSIIGMRATITRSYFAVMNCRPIPVQGN